jgi:ribonucleoside-triphosphate reductase
LHLYMWERLTDAKTCKNFVKKVLSTYQLPYITISPTFSICPEHGYIVWEHDFCPKCDAKIWYTWDEFDVQTREVYTDDEDKMKEIKEKKL